MHPNEKRQFYSCVTGTVPISIADCTNGSLLFCAYVIANHYARFPGVAILTPHLSLRTSAHAGVAIPRIFRLPKGMHAVSSLRRGFARHRCSSGAGLAIPQSAWHLTAPFTQGSHYSTIQPRLYHARDCHGSLAPQRCAERNRRRRLLARSSAHCLAMTGEGSVRAGSEWQAFSLCTFSFCNSPLFVGLRISKRQIRQRVLERFTESMNLTKASRPWGVTLNTPASSKTWVNTRPVSCIRVGMAFSSVKM